MPNNITNRYTKQATGVFHTDGIGVNPNNPSTAYAGWTAPATDKGIDVTAGHIQLQMWNQKGQFNTNGISANPNQATGVAVTQATHPYSTHIRQNS